MADEATRPGRERPDCPSRERHATMPADALDGPSSTRAVTRGIPYALAAAGLFGASTPLAKLLVGQMPPVLLAGLLYLGSGIGLAILWAMRSILCFGP